jgi:DNA-binding PadR family transcriptional regulator
MIGNFEEQVLIVLARKPLINGIDIQRAITEATRRELSPGMVYVTLHRMLEKALVVSEDRPSTNKRGGRRSAIYAITEAGVGELTEAERVRGLLRCIGQEKAGVSPSPALPPGARERWHR